jgi:hypothetical protein
MERTDFEGEKTEQPTEYVELDLDDGVVIDQVFVERTEPASEHVQGVLDEDDSFESIGTEIWEYDVADGREQDFVDALRNSRMVVEYERIDDIDMIEPGKSAPGGARRRPALPRK